MTKYNFILALLISIFIGFSVQQTFSQKKSRGKIITLPAPTPTPPPKSLSIEVTVSGGGTYECDKPGLTCTWTIDRKYSGTIIFNGFMQVPVQPFDLTKFTPKTATDIALSRTASTFNSRWMVIPATEEGHFFDVNVSINDQHKVSWLHKEKKDNQEISETRSITQTWTAGNRTGKGVNSGYVVLNRQSGAFEFLGSIDSDAKMTYTKIRSWDELNDLPEEWKVFQIPTIEGYLNSEVILPNSGDTTDDKTASFAKTFSGLNSAEACMSVVTGKECTVTVTYKFR